MKPYTENTQCTMSCISLLYIAFRQPGGGGGGGGKIHIYLEVHGQVCLSSEAIGSVRHGNKGNV